MFSGVCCSNACWETLLTHSPHSSAVARSPLAGLTLDKCYLHLDVSKDNFLQDEQINSDCKLRFPGSFYPANVLTWISLTTFEQHGCHLLLHACRVTDDTDQPTVSLCVVLKDRDELKIQKINSSERKFKRVDDWILERSIF